MSVPRFNCSAWPAGPCEPAPLGVAFSDLLHLGQGFGVDSLPVRAWTWLLLLLAGLGVEGFGTASCIGQGNILLCLSAPPKLINRNCHMLSFRHIEGTNYLS